MIRRPLLLLLLTLAACAPQSPPPIAAPPPPPQLTATGTAQRVVLVSFDGLGADMLASQTNLPAFASLERDGASARIIPVNPTATSATHASILTGAQPRVHGIVANRFHVPGTPPEQAARGLEVELDAETLVEAARRQGKRVGAVPFPTVDARSSRRMSDFGFAWTTSTTPARVIRFTRADFHREWVPPTWTERPQRRVSYSPIQRARIEWSIPNHTRQDVDLVAYDTTNDAAANYDLFLVEAGEREITPDGCGWFALSAQTSDGLYGSWSKLLRADATLNDVTLYWGAISRTYAWPESFRTMLDTEAGFWPGAADESASVDAATFIEQLDRLSDFLTRAQVLAIQRMEFDLLLAYQSQIDTALHRHFGNDTVVRAAFAAADRAVAAIRASLDPARDALIVTGDHGVAAIDTELRMNRLLADHGFASRWRAYAANNVAHLYGGDDADALMAMLNATGFFEDVSKKAPNAHRHTGDVVAYAKPNVMLSASSDAPAVDRPSSSGNHGALNVHRELHTVLFAAGAGTPRGALGEQPQTRIARFAAQLLGIQPPSAAE